MSYYTLGGYGVSNFCYTWIRGETKSSVLVMCSGVQEVFEKPLDEKESLKVAELFGKRYGM